MTWLWREWGAMLKKYKVLQILNLNKVCEANSIPPLS